MYQLLLPLHSLIRWLVLVFLLLAVFRGFQGMIKRYVFSTFDKTLSIITVKIVQIQFCIGVVLYILSPISRYFLINFKSAIHLREIRFFGLEHITMMVLAVTIVTIGSERISKGATDQHKYKIMAIWFAIGLLLILVSIPWSFSPFTSRPNFRAFSP